MAVYRIFSDESRQSKDRYMVLAGIIINQNKVDKFDKTMSSYREKTNMTSELKWSRVSNAKIKEYKIFVDHFFALCNTDIIHFKALIIDNHKVNHRRYSNGNKEEGFYKFYYQLFNWFGRLYFNFKREDTTFVIHPDYRNTKYKLGDLRDILNNGFNKKHHPAIRPFAAIEPLDSKKSEIIQVLDIILGAIGYVKNGYTLLGSSNKAKLEMCEYIRKKAGLRGLGQNSPYGQNRFSIWNFKLKK